jgi:predicted Zn finger-like uncharacterized protein
MAISTTNKKITMEIVCKNCDTRYYLSDDKIPLETRTGKCKKCGTTITVLGKNIFNSDSIIQQEISAEPEATKNCEFCGEKILAIAKKCRYCGSMLDSSHISDSKNEIEQAIKPSNKIQTDNINNKIDDTNNTKVDYSSNHYKTTKKIIKILALAVFLLGISITIIISFQISQLPNDVTTILEYRKGISYLPNNTKPFTGKFERYYSTDIFGTAKTIYNISKESTVFLSKETPEISLETHTEGYNETLLQKWRHKFFNEQKIFEENYKDGKLNGLSISWEQNGRKTTEINYENGKLKGLATRWYDDGKKLSISFTGILTRDLSEEQISTATEKMHASTDDIEGVTWYEDYETYDRLLETYQPPSVFLLYTGLFKETKHTLLRLKAKYTGYDWLFIDSFIIVVDGQKFEKLDAKFERKNNSKTIWEWYDEAVKDNDITMIKAIIESKEATIRFKGINSYSDYEITAQEKKSMKNVLDAFEALGGQFENWEK